MNRVLAKKALRSIAINGTIICLIAMAVFPSTRVLSDQSKVLIILLLWTAVFTSAALLFVFRDRR